MNRAGNRGRAQAAQAARAARAVRQAQQDRARLLIGIAVVLVIAVVVIGGVLWQNHRRDTAAQQPIPVGTATATGVAVTVDTANATVLVGSDTATVTLDAYEDFLCPVCGQYEKNYGEQIGQRLEAGTLRVRYHSLNLLDRLSNPAGYSLLAANASLVVAELAPESFLAFHDSLFRAQPAEGGAGYTAEQLITLGRAVGVDNPDLADKVRNLAHGEAVKAALTRAGSDPALRPSGGSGFGTPTVLANGQRMDVFGDPNWLDKLVSSTG